MVAKPGVHKISIPNLYSRLDKRTGKVYWQYKHPISGRFHSLGTDEVEAKQREQGVDTQKLLGHKSRKKTDKYNDDRGKNWIAINLKTG